MQTKSQVYASMIAIATGLLAVHFIFKISFLDYVALAILLIALLSYPLAALVSKGWMKFAEGLGFINSKIILSVIFFLFLVPIALIYRLFNTDKLQLKKKPSAKSYYTIRNHQYQPADIEKSW